jgi:hypothetical protein
MHNKSRNWRFRDLALQELSKKELAGLLAGATAVNAIVGRISKDKPAELPTDEIRQWEIAALYQLEAAKDALALSFKRRLGAGATVQPGPYFLTPDDSDIEDLEDEQREYSGGEFNCIGFGGVGWNDPAEPAAVETKPAKKAGKRGERKPAKSAGPEKVARAQELFEKGRRIISEIGADDRKTAGESRRPK